MNVRMSSLDRIAYCPASPLTDLNVDRYESRLGTAYHRLQEIAFIHEGRIAITRERIKDVARENLVNETDLRKLWDEDDFDPIPNGDSVETEVEMDLGPAHLVGHIDWRSRVFVAGADEIPVPDVVPRGARWAEIVDHKTGHPPAGSRRPIAYWAQGIAYGLADIEMRGLDAVCVMRHWVRIKKSESSYEALWITPDTVQDQRDWLEGLLVRAADEAGTTPDLKTYAPEDTFESCRGCAASATCPAYRREFATAMNLMSGLTGDAADVDLTDVDALRAAWNAAEWAKSATSMADALTRRCLEIVEGADVDLLDGTYLTLGQRMGTWRAVRKRKKES